MRLSTGVVCFAMNRLPLILLVLLARVMPTARGEFRILQMDSGKPGPAVLVIAAEGGAGPCALAALRQAGGVDIERGRCVLVEAVAPFSSLPRRAGWEVLPGDDLPDGMRNLPKLVLREATEVRSKFPNAEGLTVRGGDPGAARILAAVKGLSGPVDEAWLPAGPATDPNEIVVTTCAKDPNSTHRPASRERAFRVAVAAFLAHHGLRGADGAATSWMFPKASLGVLRVAVYDGAGSISSSGHGPAWLQSTLAAQSGLLVELVGAQEIRAAVLNSVDVLVMGGGLSTQQGEGLGKEGREAIRTFVKKGGGYLGICAGAFLACESSTRPYLGLLPVGSRGTSLKCATPLAWSESPTGPARSGEAPMSGGPILILSKNAGERAPDLEVWARFERDEAKAGKTYPLRATPAVVAASHGKGRVVIFGPHRERPPGEPAIFPAAVRWAGKTSR